MIEARTDVVGSLLRPADLLDARERRDRGLLTAAEFKRVEDAAVDAALRLQEAPVSTSSRTARCVASPSRAR